MVSAPLQRFPPALFPFTFNLSLPWPGIFLLCSSYPLPLPTAGRGEQAAAWVLNCWLMSNHHTRVWKTFVSKTGTWKHTVSYFLRQNCIALLTIKSTFMSLLTKSGDCKLKIPRDKWHHLLIGFGFPSLCGFYTYTWASIDFKCSAFIFNGTTFPILLDDPLETLQ